MNDDASATSQRSGFLLEGAAFAVIAFFLSLIAALNDPWRMDEAFTHSIIQEGVGSLVEHTGLDRHPPLYYLIAKVWLLLFKAPFSLKLLSSLAFAASAFVMFLTLRIFQGAAAAVRKSIAAEERAKELIHAEIPS